MIAAIYARKSTEQHGVSDNRNPSRGKSNMRARTLFATDGPSMKTASLRTTASAAPSF